MNTSFHLQAHVDDLYRKQTPRLAFKAASADEFQMWQYTLREKLRELLVIDGRVLPTSVDAVLLDSVDMGDYVEQKYALDVGEGVRAPMFLLIPKTPPPYKPLLALHGHGRGVQDILGHYPDAEMEREQLARDEDYAQSLARAGHLVCALEQRGFGERICDQYNAERQNSCAHLSFEYMMQGRTLLGERIWDAMLAMTYLQQREDVFANVMGCTGNSGGGTTTLFLSALDERVTVSVPACYFCSFKHSILGMYHCECNYVPHLLEYVEMGDLTALIAPRPLRLIAGEQDPIFPIGATREQYQTVERAYSLLGASERCSLAVHRGGHAYDWQSAIEWFKRWL
jgi:hypothetical protein